MAETQTRFKKGEVVDIYITAESPALGVCEDDNTLRFLRRSREQGNIIVWGQEPVQRHCVPGTQLSVHILEEYRQGAGKYNEADSLLSDAGL